MATEMEFVHRVVRWLRAGYPPHADRRGYSPLVALYGQLLTDEQVDRAARAVLAATAGPITDIEVHVAISTITEELPRPRDVQRVKNRIAQITGPNAES
ncbi:DUF3349 domain-containing protein [Rhodococcus artemisiae]|uniref:DUF3349 domain-containing protein n=1 Tax=Rhodococcus artemisiae TaxID=714159 RepID=A0ABU7LJV2_9NOCA|nr:DUF3349 domain-containing protein [Rhodococcus artemisiae]MEE2061781.1 DUF3349 domain-containing protein [Rhodococcus artemisiae]